MIILNSSFTYNNLIWGGGKNDDEYSCLTIFFAVAREKSIAKVAEVLHMPQPPLSRQLKNLEDELGKQLLIRENYKITLTEEGLIL